METTWPHIVWTILLLIVFVGIVFWAWSGRQRRRFEQAARLPLEDDRPASARTDADAPRPRGDRHA